MSVYVNIGNAGFRSARNGKYVDKSWLIAVFNDTLNSKRRFSGVTRSRCFGKPMAAEMLKYDDSADSAISQIKQKEYFKKLSEDVGDILLVGINYDRKTKKHVCQIERWQE